MVGKAWQNGYAERMMRTIKEEEMELSEYEDYRRMNSPTVSFCLGT
jgi:putative transposase